MIDRRCDGIAPYYRPENKASPGLVEGSSRSASFSAVPTTTETRITSSSNSSLRFYRR